MAARNTSSSIGRSPQTPPSRNSSASAADSEIISNCDSASCTCGSAPRNHDVSDRPQETDDETNNDDYDDEDDDERDLSVAIVILVKILLLIWTTSGDGGLWVNCLFRFGGQIKESIWYRIAQP